MTKKKTLHPSSHVQKLKDEQESRIRKITTLLDESSTKANLEKLRKIACQEGLINNAIRSTAWPKLLAIEIEEIEIDYANEIKEHKDTDQVAKDIDRSLWKFTTGKGIRQFKRQQLSRVINAILSRNPDLHYYQGFHDIASVFLLVAVNEQQAFAMMESLSRNHIRFALNSSLDSAQKILSLLFPLLSFADPELFRYFCNSEIEQPIFALAWVITWFSHGFDDLDTIARLFDLFITSHPLMPIYVGVEIIIHFRETLLKKVNCEYSAVHTFLCNIPQNLPFEKIIHASLRLFEVCPPQKLFQRQRTMKISTLAHHSFQMWRKKNQYVVITFLIFITFLFVIYWTSLHKT